MTAGCSFFCRFVWGFGDYFVFLCHQGILVMENYQYSQRRLSNTTKPEGMGLEEWQVALRQQQAMREQFVISEVSELYSPGEYSVRNPRSRSSCSA